MSTKHEFTQSQSLKQSNYTVTCANIRKKEVKVLIKQKEISKNMFIEA